MIDARLCENLPPQPRRLVSSDWHVSIRETPDGVGFYHFSSEDNSEPLALPHGSVSVVTGVPYALAKKWGIRPGNKVAYITTIERDNDTGKKRECDMIKLPTGEEVGVSDLSGLSIRKR